MSCLKFKFNYRSIHSNIKTNQTKIGSIEFKCAATLNVIRIDYKV